MDTVAGLLMGLMGAVGGVLIGYLLSGSRAQREWRAQKRAEVLGEMYARLSRVQTSATLATLPGVPLQVRKQRVVQNKKAMEDLSLYLHAHALWVDARTLPTIKAFVDGLSSALRHYEVEINSGTPGSSLALRAAGHVQRLVPEAEQILEQEFRAIVYPKTWREHLASGLEWLETRNRKQGGENTD